MSRDTFTRRRVLMADLVAGTISCPNETPAVPLPRCSRVLVRLHKHPMGVIDIDDIEPTIETIRTIALQRLRPAIEEHLAADGAPTNIVDFASVTTVEHCPNDLGVVPDANPLMTVCIATMSNAESMIDTVRRVLVSNYQHLEVIVVDNAPGDTSTKEAFDREISDDRVRYVPESTRGLSRVRNRGLSEANGEFIAFIDDDVLVDENWLSAIANTFCQNPSVACVTGSILAVELETPAQYMLEQFGGFNKGNQRQIYDMGEHRRDTPLYPYAAGRFGSGANTSFRVDALEAIGGFANDLGAGTKAHGGEDFDIMRRVITSGYVLVYEPSAIMWHHHRRTYTALETTLFRYGVGLSATITKWLFESPKTSWEVMSRIPAGIEYAVSPRSFKNSNKARHYPRQLTWLERAGFAVGPFAYIRSRFETRRLDNNRSDK